ncbi:MAG: small subunit ribosomal protein S18 [Lentimonas sp.]|jgi:small subunit ribosomal protein S18
MAYKQAQNNNNNKDDDFLKISLVNQSVFIRKRRSCPLKGLDIEQINYKNLKLLNKFLTERGKIIPARATNVSMKKQSALGNAIKKARHLALLSPIEKIES